MNEALKKTQEIWDQFLVEWPINAVKEMTLEQYTQVQNKNSFTYWLEHETRLIADIRGGDASKFGIFHRSSSEEKSNTLGRIYEKNYCWYSRFGATKDEAFQTIKNNIVEIINAIRAHDLKRIEHIQISSMFKWKIAFLYQDPHQPQIVSIFSKNMLDSLTQDKTLKYYETYSYLLQKIGQLSILEFSQQLLSEYIQLTPQNKLTMDIKQKLNQPLNRILFGAAGTGKTFHTINHALSIIENVSLTALEQEDRKALKTRFDQYQARGHVKFVTFHQSFSYEDFVEGIQATVNDQGQLTYHIKPGIFQEICHLASSSIANLGKIIGKTFGQGYIVLDANQFMITIQKMNGNILHLSTDLAQLLYKAVISKTITIQDIHQKNAIDKLPPNPLLEPFIVKGYNTLWAHFIQLMINELSYESTDKIPYVLIIDEINRGNISRIFGELITLIEDSKRAGENEALSITLPYSKKELFVPNQLHIIGTMNASDRSLMGLDIALRRRFTFIEMQPQPELLKDINIEGLSISDLLSIINQRIEILIDRDHCIGHAHFIILKDQKNLETLSFIFKEKIIPQLQEYFFNDWSKINLVLNNNGMFEESSVNTSHLFSQANLDNLNYLEDQQIWKINYTAFDSIESYKRIVQPLVKQ